jgi:PKD repeat protein
VLSAAAGGPYSGPEGSAIPLQGTITGAGGAAVTTTWSAASGAGVDAGATCSFANVSALNTTVTCTDDGTYTLTLTAGIAGGPTKSATAQLTVGNVKPSLTITAPAAGSLYAIPATVSLQSSFTDPGTNDTQTCSVNWDDGSALEVFAAAGNACNRTHTFSAAGVYTIAVTVTDDDGGTDSASTFAVVYDGSAGFVTGGGSIDSPEGAYPADRTLAGRATFGFVSKYAKGATTPTGETEFQFQAAAFNFHSTAYDWLVVAGAKAQFKGSGTVNGVAGYAFLLTATDGQVNGGGGVDRLRLKVWSAATGAVVYDNVLGAGDDLDTASPQALSSGSIVIHK